MGEGAEKARDEVAGQCQEAGEKQIDLGTAISRMGIWKIACTKYGTVPKYLKVVLYKPHGMPRRGQLIYGVFYSYFSSVWYY